MHTAMTAVVTANRIRNGCGRFGSRSSSSSMEQTVPP
jgi:hypothetical protein